MRRRVILAVAFVIALMATVVPALTSASATSTRGNSDRGPVAAHSQSPPNFDGTWISAGGGFAFTITSGTSTSIVGKIFYPPQCPGSSGTVRGTIVDGSGELSFLQNVATANCILGIFPETTVKSSRSLAASRR